MSDGQKGNLMCTIYGKNIPVPAGLAGVCDFLVDLPAGRRVRLLQLTDMQVIDANQRRTADRLTPAEIICWQPERMRAECFDHIRSLVAQTRPDLIFITGDIVYGEFDDSGKSLLAFCSLMDSFRIPWLPVFGNHDNESARGVLWQCARFEESAWCLFRRGTVHGNGNYTVGIRQGGTLIRVLYMMDSNGCGGTDPCVYHHVGFHEDQVEWLNACGQRVTAAAGNVPGFVAFHIPTVEFIRAAVEKGYQSADPSADPSTRERPYVIGVDCPAQDGDFGCKREQHSAFKAPGDFRGALASCHADGVFVGHCHAINTTILWQGIRWTYGLKTGQYDYHIPGQIGGTLIELEPDAAEDAPNGQAEVSPFTVRHVPSLTLYGPFPKGE